MVDNSKNMVGDCKNTYGRGFTDPEQAANQPDSCAGVPTPIATNPACKPWQLSLSGDAEVIDSYIAESLNIAAADANVYKLLGVHEQEKLVDATGFGTAISGGSKPAYPAKNAFTLIDTSWTSLQCGPEAIIALSLIHIS